MQTHVLLALTVIAAGTIAEGAPVGFDNATASAGEAIRGFASHAAVAGEPLTVNIGGVVSATAASTIAAGDALAVAADGKVATADEGDAVIGTAWTGGTAGKSILVLLK
jgi:hypothetical protein